MLNNPLSIPMEAKQYYPTQENYFLDKTCNYGETKIRQIFEGQDSFTDEESKLINEFLDIANRSDKDLCFIKSDILRFIYLSDFDPNLAFTLSTKSQEFMSTIFPINLTDNIKRIFEKKMIYTYGRDCFYRPILIINCLKIEQEKAEISDLKLSIMFMMDYIVKYMLLPGQIENINIIFQLQDLTDSTTNKTIPDSIIFILNLILNNYPIRVFSIFFNDIENDSIKNLKTKWNLIGVEFGDYSKLLKFIHPEQLEEKFGGSAESLENNINFTPFNASKNFRIVSQMISTENLATENNENTILGSIMYRNSDAFTNKFEYDSNDVSEDFNPIKSNKNSNRKVTFNILNKESNISGRIMEEEISEKNNEKASDRINEKNIQNNYNNIDNVFQSPLKTDDNKEITEIIGVISISNQKDCKDNISNSNNENTDIIKLINSTTSFNMNDNVNTKLDQENEDKYNKDDVYNNINANTKTANNINNLSNVKIDDEIIPTIFDSTPEIIEKVNENEKKFEKDLEDLHMEEEKIYISLTEIPKTVHDKEDIDGFIEENEDDKNLDMKSLEGSVLSNENKKIMESDDIDNELNKGVIIDGNEWHSPKGMFI